MRLRAEAPEERAVPGDDVVGVEAVEAGGLRAADERRVPEDAHALELGERRRPVRGGVAVGVVDVEVRHAGRRRAARCPPRSTRASGRRTAPGAPRPRARTRAAAAATSGRRVGLGRVPRPTTRRPPSRFPRRDLAHLRGDDARVRRRVEAARRVVRRRQHLLCRRARRTSAPSRRPASGSSTTGSRRSRRRSSRAQPSCAPAEPPRRARGRPRERPRRRMP